MFHALGAKRQDRKTTRRPPVAAALGGALVFAAALGILAPAAPAQSSYETLERLLPAATIGVLTLPSTNHVQDILNVWYAAFQGGKSPSDSDVPDVLHEIAELIGMDPRYIDPQRPILGAFSLALAGAPPMPTVIVPVHDEAKTLAAFEFRESSPFSTTHAGGDGYVVLTAVPEYVPDAGRFELGAPRNPDDVRLALDLATLYETFGPMLQYFLSAMVQEMQEETGGPSMLEPTTRAAEWLQDVLENAERLELTLAAAQERVRLSSTLRSRPGSPPFVPVYPSDRMLDLTRLLDEDAAALVFVSADMRAFYDWSMAIQEGELTKQLDQTSEQGEAFLALLEYGSQLQRLLAGPNAYTIDFGAHGIDAVHVMQVEDGGSFVEIFRQAMASLRALEPLGLALHEGDATRLEGVDVYTWRASFDSDRAAVRPQTEPAPTRDLAEIHRRLFGGAEGIARLAVVDDIAVFVVHPDAKRMREILKRIQSKSGYVPKRLRTLAEQHGTAPWLVGDADLHRLLAGFFDALINPDALENPDAYREFLKGPAVPVSVASSQGPGVLHSEFTANVRALASFFEALSHIFPEKKRASKNPDG